MSTTAPNPADPTPLLDRAAPLPQPAGRESGSEAAIVIVIGLGIVIATFVIWRWRPGLYLRQWILAHFAPIFPGPGAGPQAILMALSAVMVGFVAVIVHEVGHVVGGICAGFRFNSLAIGPLQIDRPFRISLNRGPVRWLGGWASMFPLGRDKPLLRGLALVSAGPAANLLTGCAVLLLPFSKGFLSAVFIFSSLSAVVVDLLPLRWRTVSFDGWRIVMLLRNPAWTERWLALMKLAAEIRAGAMPESWSTDCLNGATAFRDDSPDTVAAHAMAYAVAFHQHDDPEAARALETCLRYSKHAAPAVPEALMSDAAVFQARRRKRADLAEGWLAELPEKTRFPGLRSRAEAAILEARGDVEGAAEEAGRERKGHPHRAECSPAGDLTAISPQVAVRAAGAAGCGWAAFSRVRLRTPERSRPTAPPEHPGPGP